MCIRDSPWIKLSRWSAQAANQTDLAANADRAKRTRNRAGATDLDHAIDAATSGEFYCRFVPVGRCLVVNSVVSAELLRAREFVVTRRVNDNLYTHSLRQLQAEDRNASGNLSVSYTHLR